MEINNAIRLRINNLIIENNINSNQLALRAGISRSTLRRFLNKEYSSITISTLTLLCQAFNITLRDFFDCKLFDEVEVLD